MPSTRTRRSRIWSAELDPYRREELLNGAPALLAGVGYGALFPNGSGHWTDDQRAAAHAELRADWRRHGRELTSTLLAERPGCRPWAWWEFDAPEPRRQGEPDIAYLARLKLFQPGESDRLPQDPAEAVR